MTKTDLINKISEKIKLIRTEYGFSQDKMAEIIGISKKTLVQIEKERKTLSWTAVCAVCAIFRESEILKMILSDDPVEIIEVFALQNTIKPKNPTMGGKLWWATSKKKGNYILQQNKISGHYRIINSNNMRLCSSFDKNEILKKFNEITEVNL